MEKKGLVDTFARSSVRSFVSKISILMQDLSSPRHKEVTEFFYISCDSGEM